MIWSVTKLKIYFSSTISMMLLSNFLLYIQVFEISLEGPFKLLNLAVNRNWAVFRDAIIL